MVRMEHQVKSPKWWCLFRVEVTGKVGHGIGDQAPDIAMNNPKGKEMKLSDLKGSYVLD